MRICFLIISLLFFGTIISCEKHAEVKTDNNLAFQQDSDAIRLEHLVYWTGLIEDYKLKTGKYPLEDDLSDSYRSQAGKPAVAGLVRIATREQQLMFNPESPLYWSDMDNNSNGTFQEFTMARFVEAFETEFGHEINEKYDIQTKPFETFITYNYFVTEGGYIMWVPCLSCGVTKSSTLLLDGKTPTVNIASKSMVEAVFKAKTRSDMLKDPHFKVWTSYKMQDPEKMRSLEESLFKDSKFER